MTEKIINGRQCRVFTHGVGGPVFVWGMHSWQGGETEELAREFSALHPDAPFSLFAFEADSWDDDFSPWAAACGERSFSGHGGQTLSWLTDSALPMLKESLPEAGAYYLLGYSLAGLFALWASYESGAFDGAASCSGSLWFPGFTEYLEKTHRPMHVYLSLGGKEAVTADPVMASVGEKTKTAYDILRRDENIIEAVYEMNKGGHFANAAKRLAKAMSWLYRADSKEK